MKKMVKVAMALGAFAMALMFLGCQGMEGPGESKPITSNEGTGSISGKAIYQEGVSDYSGITIVLERLAAENRSAVVSQSFLTGRAATSVFSNTVTKADGSYEFKNLPDGSYTVYASNGDEAAYRSVTIAEGASVTVEDLKLVLKGSLSGTLQVTGGSAAGSIVGVAGTSYIAFVDEDGKFTISGIPAGKHKLCVMTNGKYQAFPTEYTVDGKTTTKAGVLSVTIENTSSDNALTYVTAMATERGIYFSGTIPSNVLTGSSNSSSNYTNTICSIAIWEKESGISMHKEWTINTNDWNSWNMTYPLVDTDKKYNFDVSVGWHNYTFYSQNITITATGGLGEFRIENKDDYDIELTADRVIQNTGKPVFTNNSKVNVKRVGTDFYVNKYKTKPSNYWDGGSWVYSTVVYGDYNRMPLKDVYYLSGWREYEIVDALLSGNWYGIQSVTRVEIAGYSEDDNIYFDMNDVKQKFGEWGGQRKKVLVEYGWSIEGNINDADSYTKFEFYDSKTNKKTAEIKGLPGTKHGDYTYSEVYDFDDVIYEPQTLPEVEISSAEAPYAYRFRKWNKVFPFNLTSLTKETVDGTEYYVQKITADFVPDVTVDIKFMMNDGTDSVYATKKISTEKSAAYDSWPNWASLEYLIKDMPEPVRKGYKFLGWFIDKECKIAAEGRKYGEKASYTDSGSDLKYTVGDTLYAGWAEEVSVKLMDGEKVIDTVTSYVGADITSIKAPSKDDYVFTGWYTDSNFTDVVSTVTKATTVLYAKYAETVTLWSGNSNYAGISRDVLADLSIGDTIYFEIYYNASSGNRVSSGVDIGNGYTSAYRSYNLNGGESKVLTYTIESNSTNFVYYAKEYGLSVNSNFSNVYIKKIFYVPGPNHTSTPEND